MIHVEYLAGCTEDGAGCTYNEHANVAVALAMPDGGLITPVLKDADSTDIYTLSREWGDLVKRGRTKKLALDEINSGTFTMSNLGMFGVDTFTSILPLGEWSGKRFALSEGVAHIFVMCFDFDVICTITHPTD